MGGFSQVLGTVSSSIRQTPILKTAENLIGEWLWLQPCVFHSFHVSTRHKIASEVPSTCLALQLAPTILCRNPSDTGLCCFVLLGSIP